MQRIVFDAASLPGDETQRKTQWIEHLSSGYVRLNADPEADMSFRGSLRIAALENAVAGTIEGTVKAIVRTAREIAMEDTDNLVLLCNVGTTAMGVAQNGTEIELRDGASVLIEQCRPSRILTPRGNCQLLAFQTSRERLRARQTRVEQYVMVPSGSRSAALSLAKAYADILLREDSNEYLEDCAADHIADLIVAAIAPVQREPAETGMSALRLRAAKDYVAANLGSPGLSASDVAARHGISPTYLRKLFSASGVSFGDYVLAERLDRAQRMLRDPRFSFRTIGSLAFEVGFSDLSYFNRTFRRRFGMTPSEARMGGRG